MKGQFFFFIYCGLCYSTCSGYLFSFVDLLWPFFLIVCAFSILSLPTSPTSSTRINGPHLTIDNTTSFRFVVCRCCERGVSLFQFYEFHKVFISIVTQIYFRYDVLFCVVGGKMVNVSYIVPTFNSWRQFFPILQYKLRDFFS